MANMADTSEPSISETYEEVRNDNNGINWLLLEYESNKSDKLILKAKGTGGLSELVDNLNESEVEFAYVRVNMPNDEVSLHTKFVFVIWVGSNANIARKAKLTDHVLDVKRVLQANDKEVEVYEKSELSEDEIITQLRRA